MMMVRHLRSASCAALMMLLTANTAAAQQSLEEIKQELAALREEVRQLRNELEALRQPPAAEAGAPSSLQPSLELLQTQVAELSQVKVESTSRMGVKIFGTIHTNVFANSGTANWLDNPNLVDQVPLDGREGTFSTTLRQTRLGFTVDGPTLGSARTSGVMAMDFFGGIPGFATGQVMGLPRLLVAFARIETDRTALEIGQDHMMLAPLDPTSLAAFSFPALFRSGNLYLRTPQVRVEREVGGGIRVMGGIVAPIAGDTPSDIYRFVPLALAGERSRRPSVQGRVGFERGDAEGPRRVNVGVSGHFGWELKGGAIEESSAAAVDFAVRRDLVGAAGELFVGENIDAFGGASGLDAVKTAGGWGELQLYPSQRLTLAVGAGLDKVRGEHPFTLPRVRNRSAYGSVIFSLTPEVQAGFEYHWLATLPNVGLGSERRNHHFDWTLAYRF